MPVTFCLDLKWNAAKVGRLGSIAVFLSAGFLARPQELDATARKLRVWTDSVWRQLTCWSMVVYAQLQKRRVAEVSPHSRSANAAACLPVEAPGHIANIANSRSLYGACSTTRSYIRM